ncbi:hypothetical protein TSUD_309880 [Trifolium subterraneum]|uniref:Uncharacterized protein n=1 Tax=Trifolium subterraneum TaxID=3900 RepID=A0A2Z6LS32_TRISU|nr:hypothetical protein TSUD_309880 [Trifolium subterraneum]
MGPRWVLSTVSEIIDVRWDDIGCGCDVDRRKQWPVVSVLVVEVVTVAAAAEVGAGAGVGAEAQWTEGFALSAFPIAMHLTGEIHAGVSAKTIYARIARGRVIMLENAQTLQFATTVASLGMIWIPVS